MIFLQQKDKRETSAKRRAHGIGIILFLFTIFAVTFFTFTIFSLKANGLLDESEDDAALCEEDSIENRAYSEILVPNLVNQSFENLQKEYKENQQFKICILDKELNDNIDIGHVVSQIPQK
ncbi:MAG: PASTA domain-containing protein [Clostridia bacterium]|nr:PASTA domain-containing protein [Clostridia bacterium]